MKHAKYSLILNLTQHPSTEEQRKEGVTDLPSLYRKRLIELLTFDELPSTNEVRRRAEAIYDLIIDFCIDESSPVKEEVEKMIKEVKENGDKREYLIDEKEFQKLNLGFMIGGALWLMKPLIEELENIGTPLFSFTKRIVEEHRQTDGSVKKIAMFKHEGFIPAC